MGQLTSNLRHPPRVTPEDPEQEAAVAAPAADAALKADLPSRLDPEALRARAESIDARCPYCHECQSKSPSPSGA